MTNILLYQIPSEKWTHNTNEFSLSPATFKFTVESVIWELSSYIAKMDAGSDIQFRGLGDSESRTRAIEALKAVEALGSGQDMTTNCPDSVCEFIDHVFVTNIQEQTGSVDCHECDIEYTMEQLIESKWKVDHGEGRGSGGIRLACPYDHYVYANIQWVMD